MIKINNSLNLLVFYDTPSSNNFYIFNLTHIYIFYSPVTLDKAISIPPPTPPHINSHTPNYTPSPNSQTPESATLQSVSSWQTTQDRSTPSNAHTYFCSMLSISELLGPDCYHRYLSDLGNVRNLRVGNMQDEGLCHLVQRLLGLRYIIIGFFCGLR
jgi:hypothetical protein